MKLDPETRRLMEELRVKMAQIDPIRQAVLQLEDQMQGLPATIENKLAAVRRFAYDDRGNYRGVAGSEDDARCFGLFVMATVGDDPRAREALHGEMRHVYERAMGSDSIAAGGGLVPVEYANRIQRLVESFGVFAANAFPMTMPSDQLTFQRQTQGLTVYKTGQNVAATASDLGFANVNLNADEWNTLTLYPKSLGEDSAIDIGEMLMLDIALAFAKQMDTSAFMGDGTPSSLDVWGILPRLASINGVDDGGGLVLGSGDPGDGWSGLVEADFLKVAGQTPLYKGLNPKWYCSNPFFWTVMAPIQLAKGGTTTAEFGAGPQLQFLGAPVQISQVFPKVTGNSQVCAIYGDVRLSSTWGRRKGLTIDESRDVKFIERQVAVLGTQRHAIANHSLGDATNAGPVVGLMTQAAM